MESMLRDTAQTPPERLSGVKSEVNWKQLAHFVINLGVVIGLLSYYAFLLGMAEWTMFVASGVIGCVMVLCYAAFSKFRGVIRYFFWGLTYGTGLASVKLLVFWILFTYEFHHLLAEIEANFDLMFSTGKFSAEERSSYTAHHKTVQMTIAQLHWWIWAPLIGNLFYNYWEAQSLLSNLQTRLLFNADKLPPTKTLHPAVKFVLGVTSDGIQGIFAPFVAGCFFCCHFAMGLISAEEDKFFDLKDVKDLRNISHFWTFTIYIFFCIASAFFAYFENFFRNLQFTLLLEFFEHHQLSVCKYASPERMDELMERIRLENAETQMQTRDDALKACVSQMHDKILNMPRSKNNMTINRTRFATSSPSAAASKTALSTNTTALPRASTPSNAKDLLVHFKNTSRRDIEI